MPFLLVAMQYFMCIDYIQKYTSDNFSSFMIAVYHILWNLIWKLFITIDSWVHKNQSMLSTCLGCLPGSVLLQAMLSLWSFCHLKSNYYTKVSLETLITELVENFKMKKGFKSFSVYRFWKEVILCVWHSSQTYSYKMFFHLFCNISSSVYFFVSPYIPSQS